MPASRATDPALARRVVATALTLVFCVPATALAAATADPASLATALCARTIAKTGAAVARKQLVGLGSCLDRTLQCLATKPGDQGCLDRGRATCARTLRRLATAESTAVRAIAETCEPASTSVLDVAGLGYALVADRCATDFGAPLSGASTIGRCIVREHRCGALGILAAQEPGAATILASAGVDGESLACLGSSAASSTRALLATDGSFRCGYAARRAGRAFALTRLQKLGECAHAVVACGDGAADRDACLTAAQRACERAVAALPSTMIRLGRGVDRACPHLATSTDAAEACVPPDGGGGRLPSDAASCLLQRDGCLIDELLRFESPRSAALLSEIGIDARRTLCAADTIPPTPAPTAAGDPVGTDPASTQIPARTPTRTPTPRRTPTRTPTRTRTPTPTVTSTPPVVQALAIDSTGSVLRAGTNGGGIFESSSGGDSWTPSNAGLTTLTVAAIAVDPKTPAVVYAGTDGGGVFTSTSGGASWTASNAGLTNPVIRSLAIDPATPAILFAGTAGSGVFRSDSAGASWTAVNAGLANRDVSALVVDPAAPANVYAGTAGSGVFKSTDGGTNWTRTTLVDSFAGAAVVRSLAIDPVTTSVVYVGSNERGVFKSADGGDTWAITSLFSAFPSAASVRALAVDPLTPSTLYAGTNRGGVFVTQDGGATWTPTSLAGSFPNSTSVRALVVDPTAPRTLYAGTQGGGVFKSTDGGLTWSPARSGLPIS